MTCLVSGLYLIQYSVTWVSRGGSPSIALHVTQNSTEIMGSYCAEDGQSSSNNLVVSRYIIATVNATDVIKVQFAPSVDQGGTSASLTAQVHMGLPVGIPSISAELVITRVK